jgi:DivIVA domain-containing protein
MLVVVVVIGALLLAGLALLLSLTGDTLEDEPLDAPDPGLPDRPLRSDDVPGLRFRTGLRGYRMSDVDTAMERLQAALRAAEGTTETGGDPRQQPQ